MINLNKIKELQNISLDDIKNIDWGHVKEVVKSRPDIYSSIILGILTLIGIIFIISTHITKSILLNSEINNLQKKLETVKIFDETQKEFDKFIENFPEPILSDQISAKLSTFAVARNIQISNFSPAQTNKDDLKETINTQIIITSDKYKNLVQFINDIEDSQYSMKIDSCSCSMQDPRARRSRTVAIDDKDLIKSDIKISAITLNDDTR